MRVIDLSQTIHQDMDIYPGDPPVRIEQVHALDKEGWRLKRLELGSHTGTHVDAPAHMVTDGKTLDALPLDRFFGKAMVVAHDAASFRKNIGLIFRDGTIDLSLLEHIESAGAPFIATGDAATLTITMERALLQREILTFTDLVNLAELPSDTEVMFFGIPLKIADGDGSPVRAFAIVEE